MNFGCNRHSGFRGEVVEIVDGRTDDGRTTETAYTISSPGAFGSGELKKQEFCFPNGQQNSILCPNGKQNSECNIFRKSSFLNSYNFFKVTLKQF